MHTSSVFEFRHNKRGCGCSNVQQQTSNDETVINTDVYSHKIKNVISYNSQQQNKCPLRLKVMSQTSMRYDSRRHDLACHWSIIVISNDVDHARFCLQGVLQCVTR